MFLSEETSKKFSFLGKFENQIKYTLFNLNNETVDDDDDDKNSKFQLLPYLNYCESNNLVFGITFLKLNYLFLF
jgi:hypothetical protein